MGTRACKGRLVDETSVVSDNEADEEKRLSRNYAEYNAWVENQGDFQDTFADLIRHVKDQRAREYSSLKRSQRNDNEKRADMHEDQLEHVTATYRMEKISEALNGYEQINQLKDRELFCKYTTYKVVREFEGKLFTSQSNTVFETEFKELIAEFGKIKDLLNENFLKDTPQQLENLATITKVSGYVKTASAVTGFGAMSLDQAGHFGEMLTGSAHFQFPGSESYDAVEMLLDWKTKLDYYRNVYGKIQAASSSQKQNLRRIDRNSSAVHIWGTWHQLCMGRACYRAGVEGCTSA